MAKRWMGEELLAMSRGFQPACVLMAAAELDLFGALAEQPKSLVRLAEAVGGDGRATAILADALVALGLLSKGNGQYALAEGVAETLTDCGADSVLAMVRHQANCLRNWAELARVVRMGHPAERPPSIRGQEGDLAAFIEAMEVASRREAGPLVRRIGPPPFTHLLDLGGGPGTWTIAFLLAAPDARATLYDRPGVIPIAERHIKAAGMAGRVSLVAGDFCQDAALPPGADLVWVSAIAHQNSRAQNRELLAKVYAALVPGGRILIRDVVMEETRTHPPAGALFAVNMLVNTPGGGTFTFGELSEDLASAGFVEPRLLNRDEGMNSVVEARRPAG